MKLILEIFFLFPILNILEGYCYNWKSILSLVFTLSNAIQFSKSLIKLSASTLILQKDSLYLISKEFAGMRCCPFSAPNFLIVQLIRESKVKSLGRILKGEGLLAQCGY